MDDVVNMQGTKNLLVAVLFLCGLNIPNSPAASLAGFNGETPQFAKSKVPSAPSESSGIPIVYSWSPRTLVGWDTGSVRIEDAAGSTYDVLPDVANIVSHFKEANIVDRTADGREKTLFECVNDDRVACAALDPRSSPDNTKIAFWVVFAKKVAPPVWTIYGQMPIPVIQGVVKTQIHIYDTLSGNMLAWDTPEGQWDMHPEWLDNETLVFVSNRAKQRTVYLRGKNSHYPWAIQRYEAHFDGTNAVRTAPHDDVSLHPYVLSDGNIITATWRVDERLGQDQGNGRVTLKNEFWMSETNSFGGAEFILLNAHSLSYRDTAGKLNALLAIHFYGERSNGDICTSNYYRRRHVGGHGQILCFPRLPPGVEGPHGSFLPEAYNVTPWAQEEDNPTFRDPVTKLHLGKASYPVGLPGGQLMLTYGRGYCFELEPKKANANFLKSGPGCDVGIYMTSRIPSEHPGDLIRIVDDPARHEFSPDLRLPYAVTYGRQQPAHQVKSIQRGAEGEVVCTLEVINVYASKLFQQDANKRCTKKYSCIDEGYAVQDIAKIALYEAKPNYVPQSKIPSKEVPYDGHELILLGYASPESDGSIKVIVPCETPYKIRGVDSAGVVFIRDQIKHSNRLGEARKCVGCHGGHTESDYQPASDFDKTIAASKSPQKLRP